MIKLVFCCQRKEGMTREEFQSRWLDEHGPLVRKIRETLPMMKRYVQSHALADEISDGVRKPRGAGPSYDGITEVWFDDLESIAGDGSDAAMAAGRALIEDEAKFLDLPNCRVFLTEEHEIF